MPQLVKGGKYVFGWSSVNNNGRIAIPVEAREEYSFKAGDTIYVLQGSRSSKGFAITINKLIKNSFLYPIIEDIPDLFHFRTLDNGYVEKKGRIYTWSKIDGEGYFCIDLNILGNYSVKAGDKLLVGRGSGYALAFIKEGRIIQEALKHTQLPVF